MKTSLREEITKIKEITSRIIKESESDIYFETLSAALDKVRSDVEKMGYELDEDGVFTSFGTGGVGYGESKSKTIGLLVNGEPIKNSKGKVLNRSVVISIYRIPSGKYELNYYKTF